MGLIYDNRREPKLVRSIGGKLVRDLDLVDDGASSVAPDPDINTPAIPVANPIDPATITADGMTSTAQPVPGVTGYRLRITEEGQAPQTTPILAQPVYAAPDGPLISGLFPDTLYSFEWEAVNSAAPVPDSGFSTPPVQARTAIVTGGPNPDPDSQTGSFSSDFNEDFS